jgi:XTP/dITP diphosphohydrolase
MRKLEPGSKLLVASHNKGKVWEINQLLAPYGLIAVSAGELNLPEPEETETTFEGNALIKALAAAAGAKLPALADDSGLEINALDGAPGVYSANWAGPSKDFSIAMQQVHDKLVANGHWKKKCTPAKANFISVLCLAWPNGKHRFFKGKVKGHVVWPPKGGNGFGYDPMFVPKGHDITFGEMQPAAKYAISHRTRAFEKFKDKCLAHLSAREPGTGPNAVRDETGLTAAAANISTREELSAFVAGLRQDLTSNGARWNHRDLARYLGDFGAALSGTPPRDEPAWRTLAKALLSARRTK